VKTLVSRVTTCPGAGVILRCLSMFSPAVPSACPPMRGLDCKVRVGRPLAVVHAWSEPVSVATARGLLGARCVRPTSPAADTWIRNDRERRRLFSRSAAMRRSPWIPRCPPVS
jgi:hypothetical protein